MIGLLRTLRAALGRRAAPAAPVGPDPALPAARAALERALAGVRADDGLTDLRATSAEGQVMLEAARLVQRCAGGGAAEGEALARALAGLIAADGAPAGELAGAAEALLGVAVARAFALSAGQSLPAEVDGALAAGADALYRLQGEQDALPSPAPVHAILPGPRPVPCSLHDAVLAWGLDQGAPASAEDPRALRLAGRPPEGRPEPLAQERWSLWSWRETGLAVAHVRMLKRPARVFLDARRGRLSWDLPGLPLLSGEAGPRGRLETSRVDGRKLRLVAASAAEGWRRDVLGQGSRLIARDSGLQQICFTLADRLDLVKTADGWLGRADGLSLEIKVEPSWRWTLDAGVLSGVRDEGSEEIQTSFELRT